MRKRQAKKIFQKYCKWVPVPGFTVDGTMAKVTYFHVPDRYSTPKFEKYVNFRLFGSSTAKKRFIYAINRPVNHIYIPHVEVLPSIYYTVPDGLEMAHTT